MSFLTTCRRALSRRRLLSKERPEATPAAERGSGQAWSVLAGMSDEEFVVRLWAIVHESHPSASDLRAVADALASGAVSREDLLDGHFAGRVEQARSRDLAGTIHDPGRFHVMGTQRSMTVDDWRAMRSAAPAAPRATQSGFPTRPRSSPHDVSVICSLWRGGEFIERYMENITSQTIFEDRCELIIVDAASPDGEGAVVEQFRERFGERIVYHRLPYRAGIYVAWNMGLALARGRYLTNANLDDLRRVDSLEIQAATLDALPHVDVVYQDHLYSADPSATFEEVASLGVVSDLPLVTPHTMFVTNPPHNAPMWRATLHGEIGLFDETCRSAGDYDFWLRALAAGKQFYKINDPHVVYYYNPKGMSTSPNTPGVVEMHHLRRRHGRALLPDAAVEAPDAFLRRVGLRDWPNQAGVPLSRYDVVQGRMRDLCRAASEDATA